MKNVRKQQSKKRISGRKFAGYIKEGRIGRRWWKTVSELQPSAYLLFT